MPITITPEQFKRETRSFWHARPKSLRDVDYCLREYFTEKARNRFELMYGVLQLMQEDLQGWTAQHTKLTINNETRYNSVRDKLGTITRLEKELEQSLVETRRRVVQIQAAENSEALNNIPGFHHNVARRMAQHDARMLAVAQHGYNDERLVGPSVDLDATALCSTRSLNSLFDLERASIPTFEDEADRLSFRAGVMPPNNIMPAGFLTEQAYDAAAHFLLLGWKVNVRTDDIIRAAMGATQGVTQTQVTMVGIYQALVAMGYLGMYFRQHCTMESVVNTLMGATPLKPMMVVVGGNTPAFQLIVVTGHRYDNSGATYFTATDALRPSNFVDFRDNGAYCSKTFGNIDSIATLLPTMGIIKMQT